MVQALGAISRVEGEKLERETLGLCGPINLTRAAGDVFVPNKRFNGSLR